MSLTTPVPALILKLLLPLNTTIANTAFLVLLQLPAVVVVVTMFLVMMHVMLKTGYDGDDE